MSIELVRFIFRLLFALFLIFFGVIEIIKRKHKSKYNKNTSAAIDILSVLQAKVFGITIATETLLFMYIRYLDGHKFFYIGLVGFIVGIMLIVKNKELGAKVEIESRFVGIGLILMGFVFLIVATLAFYITTL